MRWLCSIVSAVVILTVFTPVRAATTITFDEPAAVANLGTHLPHLTIGEVKFTPEGGVPSPDVPHVTPIASFDDRWPAPSPYDFISGKMLQVRGSTLQIDFSRPVSSFGFGGSLNATSNPGAMRIDLFDSSLQHLGTDFMLLDRTPLSQQGGMNSNSEGAFSVSGLEDISRAQITNLGDGIIAASTSSFVVDNITFQPIPEPTTLLLLLLGLHLATLNRR